jgi:hypothetical protein
MFVILCYCVCNFCVYIVLSVYAVFCVFLCIVY